ncbi:class I SAM-dependent DNA methyltransferase [Staphylococcus agnetis]|uniref:class I SAM-dependent DNA methyltransferase n=1 Tax=Staphylococcus agnetis TaxID=985762 RepID=UPI0021D2525D|nr:class I SAM-dependent methyltransferase [Staphylococcus agnetis]UXU60643.1 class I SAM-dependent methyltransferase [Staphylococcus agnetis]UXU62976.1 class I SAM-dependent methyltransferase [Staphylococcus agnetis]
MAYQNLSEFYDTLTEDQPYQDWFNVLEQLTASMQINNLLDIGCGTGTLTCLFSKIAKNVTGIDLSDEMIEKAKLKSDKITWLKGDMSNFNLNQKFDVITICCDSLNYLTTEDAVMNTFNHVYHHLNEHGLLMFDVHTAHKMETQFNHQTYIDDRDDLTLLWQATPGDDPLSVWHDLTFFSLNEDGTYSRTDESQYQRTLKKPLYDEMLKIVGFKNIQSFYDFDITNQSSHSDRLFFVATK